MKKISLNHRLLCASKERARKRLLIAGAVLVMSIGIALQMMHSVGFLSAKDVRASLHPSATAVKRLQKKWNIEKSEGMMDAMAQRRKFLAQKITLLLRSPEQDTLLEETIDLSLHPEWIDLQEKAGIVSAQLNQKAVEQTIDSILATLSASQGQSCSVLKEAVDAQGVHRVETSCIAKSGIIINRSAILDALLSAVVSEEEKVIVTVERTMPTLERNGEKMTLLGSGRSNFHGSGVGRKANVRKALSEKVQNVLVPAGAIFSFNDTLGGPVTKGNGWHDALTIFEGVNLRMAPGGGVCQASTTVFRSALRAGLPIVEQKNHSLYVHYYEAYGVGQDATVFPGKQDMKFLNDTGHDLILQSYYEGEDAYVNIFGKDDGRMVTMDGPFFASTQKEGSFFLDKPIRTGEIGWVRTVQKIDGSLDRTAIRARYQALPRSLPKTYVATTEVTKSAGQVFHAAAK